jgi:molybdopterin-guanine dinucleotide biosynthesis protein A
MPATPVLPSCSVLLLCGGRGQRMGGQDKGLIEWQGRPLVAWLHDLVRPLSDDLIISCNRNSERYRAFADRLISDDDEHFQGPLAGIRAGLQAARHDYLLVLPCDTPLLDRALLDELLGQAGSHPVMVRQGDFWEPLFSLIPKSLGSKLEDAWQAGERSPQRWLCRHDPIAVVCPPNDPRLANLNTPQLLALNSK